MVLLRFDPHRVYTHGMRIPETAGLWSGSPLGMNIDRKTRDPIRPVADVVYRVQREGCSVQQVQVPLHA